MVAGDLLGRAEAPERDGRSMAARRSSAERRRSCRWRSGPGATTLTVMLPEANSRASDRARPTSPAFDAA